MSSTKSSPRLTHFVAPVGATFFSELRETLFTRFVNPRPGSWIVRRAKRNLWNFNSRPIQLYVTQHEKTFELKLCHQLLSSYTYETCLLYNLRRFLRVLPRQVSYWRPRCVLKLKSSTWQDHSTLQHVLSPAKISVERSTTSDCDCDVCSSCKVIYDVLS